MRRPAAAVAGIAAGLAGLQLIYTVLRRLLRLAAPEGLFAESMVSMAAMLLLFAVLRWAARRTGRDVTLLPGPPRPGFLGGGRRLWPAAGAYAAAAPEPQCAGPVADSLRQHRYALVRGISVPRADLAPAGEAVCRPCGGGCGQRGAVWPVAPGLCGRRCPAGGRRAGVGHVLEGAHRPGLRRGAGRRTLPGPMLRLDGASARRHEPVRALTHACARHWTPAAAKCIIGAAQGLRHRSRGPGAAG